VRIAHKCKSVLPGGKAVNSGQNVVKNAKCLFSNLGSEIYFAKSRLPWSRRQRERAQQGGKMLALVSFAGFVRCLCLDKLL